MRLLRLMGIDHVGLTVRDMDETLAFYQRLGLTVLRTSGPNADGERSAVIQVGGQELNVFSRPEFAAAATAPGVGARPGIGMDHFCLTVEAGSIEEVLADLTQAGIAVARGPVKRRDGTALFVHDPDGTRVELQLKRRAPA
jgi:catechol 2,3-dioxygenase-like lactoylglutathione lyase family enzyme